MTWVSLFAVFFIIWWVVLFAVLPFSLRTQEEAGEVVPGTTASAPRGPHMLRAIIRTTVATAIVFAAYLFLTRYLGLGFDDLPRIAPQR
jgi:predicted secreted protein